jgi:hypothetical protein
MLTFRLDKFVFLMLPQTHAYKKSLIIEVSPAEFFELDRRLGVPCSNRSAEGLRWQA